MIKLGFNFLAVVFLVLLAVFIWRGRRRERWTRAGMCYVCGAQPNRSDPKGQICNDCATTKTIQRWLAGFMALVGGCVVVWMYWLQR